MIALTVNLTLMDGLNERATEEKCIESDSDESADEADEHPCLRILRRGHRALNVAAAQFVVHLRGEDDADDAERQAAAKRDDDRLPEIVRNLRGRRGSETRTRCRRRGVRS